ncbi:hypothetical protein [Agromyces sp. GXS1127]|uniref:hypothetical protein n=1 Tax=Agromyces sp. GXS1127 TaxID=3424181 RepID=UPI003D3199D0
MANDLAAEYAALGIVDVFGADRGIVTHGDLPVTHTTDGESLSNLWREFNDTLAQWNSDGIGWVGLFSTPTTDSSFISLQNVDADEFEDESEMGIPKSIRPNITPLRVGFPLKFKDAAVRYTRKYLRDATSDEVASLHNHALTSDQRTVTNDMFRALLTKQHRTNEKGDTVYDLWDGTSGEVPPSHAGKDFTDSHSHYLVSGAATIDGKDLGDLINTITEHGYGDTAGDRIVIIVHPDQGDTVRGFRAGVAESPYDFIATSTIPYLTNETVVGARPPAEFQGKPVIGQFGSALVVETRDIPTGYVIATATGSSAPLAKREHVRPEQRGLRIIAGSESAVPIIDSYYSRGVGFGVRLRGAAAVMQITASGSYANPSI